MSDGSSNVKLLAGFLGLSTIGLLVSTIILATNSDESDKSALVTSNVPDHKFYDIASIFADEEDNTCKDMNPKYENVDCIHVDGPQAGANVTNKNPPQAGSNVTKGYIGGLEVDVVPNTNNYWQSSMCPVNVHWHLGTEHYSVDEYDENGDGPNGNIAAPVQPSRRLAGKENVRPGFRCHHFDDSDEKFTTEYDWKHCIGMEVGETYEVHWPHSAAGACGTVNQYQTPFYDGVFCNLPTGVAGLTGQQIASAVGVQGQIFTIVNDESYFYPDMIRGWIVDGDYGKDIHYYTGSTTGTSRSNEICSAYAPITWQVDRKCHMISASSFDKLCYDMKLQRDDMEDDLHAHGSRELVHDYMVANNQQRRRGLHGSDHEHEHDEWI